MTNFLARRYRKERYLKYFGWGSIAIALLFLLILAIAVIGRGWTAFLTAETKLSIYFDAEIVETATSALGYKKLTRNALAKRFPDVKKRADKKELRQLLSFRANLVLADYIQSHPEQIGKTVSLLLPLSSVAERYLKGGIDLQVSAEEREISPQQAKWLDHLQESGETRLFINHAFFTAPDSRDAEAAGLGAAFIGSFYTLLLTFIFSFPLAVLAATYLEMFAPRNRWFDFIEVNINNLASVPSIIFGLLGLSIFINFFGLPRSSPLVGSLVLTLMTLPTIIIVARASIKAVPSSLLAGALSLGATKMQGVFHFVLVQAMPGILTGSIIGMARALGETAPLLMIGMVAFITDLPQGLTDVATALPVQIFLWADSPERGFVERTSAAIIVLLIFLILMNITTILLRKRMERKL